MTTRNPLSLYYATLFKILKYLLDNRIKPTIEAQFTVLQNRFTQRVEGILNQRIRALANILVESMN